MNKKALIVFSCVVLVEKIIHQQRQLDRLTKTVDKLVKVHNKEQQRKYDRVFQSIVRHLDD